MIVTRAPLNGWMRQRWQLHFQHARLMWSLFRLWHRYPRVRFMQLVGNLFPTNDDHYHVPDRVVEAAVQRALKNWG